MKTETITAGSPDAIQQALEVLQAGGLVAFPTDTVYGVGALAFDGKAVESIYKAKDRPIEKAIPVLIGDAEDITKISSGVPLIAKKLAERFWPGPLTIVVPKHLSLPDSVSATNTVGVRVPDHVVARSVLRAAGPMAVTSANLSGQPSPSTAQEVFAQLNGRIALIVDGGKTPGGVPSTLVDCTGPQPIVVRQGPISLNQILFIMEQ
jgi:L-threonylcarbamoyladenylate synthase